MITLTPGLGGTLVTSERAVVRGVNMATAAIDLRTSDGRDVRLTGEQTSTERLGYGYATTVHRCQGATVTRAHLFADGESRELAYVALSRARESTHAWVVADDLAQAAEDLRRDWSTHRTPTWAIDTGLPDHEKLTAESVAGMADEQKVRLAAIAHAQIKITARAIARIEPTHLAPALADARAALQQTQQARTDLDMGLGIYRHTDASQAVGELIQARAARYSAAWRAEHGTRWRDRRAAAKEAANWAAREADAQQRWETHVVPEAARLDDELDRHRAAIELLTTRLEREAAASKLSGEEARQLHRASGPLAAGLEAHRDGLDGLAHPPARSAPGHTHQVRVHAALQHEPPDGADLGPRPEL